MVKLWAIGVCIFCGAGLVWFGVLDDRLLLSACGCATVWLSVIAFEDHWREYRAEHRKDRHL